MKFRIPFVSSLSALVIMAAVALVPKVAHATPNLGILDFPMVCSVTYNPHTASDGNGNYGYIQAMVPSLFATDCSGAKISLMFCSSGNTACKGTNGNTAGATEWAPAYGQDALLRVYKELVKAQNSGAGITISYYYNATYNQYFSSLGTGIY